MGATQKLLRFGLFELNLDTQELRKDGIPLKLSPQPFRILALLATRAGQIVSREEIRQQIWGEETFVDFEHGLNQCIKQIRTALNDNADTPLYVETLPRRGYRFLAPVVSKTISVPAPKVVESKSGVQEAAVGLAAPTKPGIVSADKIVVSETPPSVPVPTVATFPISAPAAAATARAPDVEPPSKPERNTTLWLGLGVVAIAIIGVLVGEIYWKASKPKVLTEKDTVVLSDFVNTTGDAVFDDALKQGLSFQLEQSPFLDLISDRKVNQTLKLMGRSAGERLTPELAREVCQRTGSRAMLTGSIAAVGNQYVISLKAVNCETGERLTEAQEQAAGKDAVLKALNTAAVGLRSNLGESLKSLEKYATPVEDTTTSSLEALKAYSLGRKMADTKGQMAALPFYKRAVELDPNFAMAYAGISVVYSNINEVGRAARNAVKAYELRDKVSERERFYIEGNYYLTAIRNFEKAAQTYELWQQTYPRDPLPYINLGFINTSVGNHEKALEEAREALRVEPSNSINYVILGNDYANLNRLDEAEAVYQQAEQRKLESEFLLYYRYQLAFLKRDNAQMEHLAASAVGEKGAEETVLASQADTEAWFGRYDRARGLTSRAVESARNNDAKEAAATYQATAALREAEAGNRRQSMVDADAALKLASNRDVQAMAALAFASAGDTAKATKLAAQLAKALPEDTLIQKYWLPTIGAAVALQRKDPGRALELLRVSSKVELGQPTNLAVYLCPVYLRGEAYLMLHDGKAAVAEFQKFADHRGLVVNFPWGALARLGTARAHLVQGDANKARAAYRDFLTLWNGADPDIPILAQAKSEYASLH